MRCPLLREEQVKSCQASPFRKRLVRSEARGAAELCSSADHARCPVARQSREAHPSPARCPFLQESLVQFCAATPAPTYVPWSASPELRCGHDGHRFCELYLAAGGRDARGPALPAAHALEASVEPVAGVPLPNWLLYAENHLWLDLGDDGLCHVGIDAFLAQLVGSVERLTFLTTKGTARPAFVLTTRGVDLTLVFPQPLAIVAVNSRLRSSLERLTADPYGLGWLFEARLPTNDPGRRGAAFAEDLRRGEAARTWMEREVRQLSEQVHARHASGPGGRLAADGGRFSPDLVRCLERDEILRLFADLFPIPDTRRTP
jgi:glycine cleavage system H lipoate-binding protein